jgi:hypothetical protein
VLNRQAGNVPAAAPGTPDGAGAAAGEPPRRPGRPRLAWAGALAVAAVVLFWCYLRQSQADAVNADGAGMVLQGWEMVHGNVLLSGWALADVTFYTFEVPIDGLVALAHGLNSDVVHITAAIVYTLLVLTAALLAKGAARGAEGVVRAVLAAAILVAPSLSAGTHVLLLSPDHTGIAVPILLTLLLVDRLSSPGGTTPFPVRGLPPPHPPGTPREHARSSIVSGMLGPRWWVPAAMGVLLVWAQIGDSLATYAAALPIALTCLVRAALPLLARRRPGWYDAALAAAAVVSVEVTRLVLAAIKAAGGFHMQALKSGIGTLFPFTSWRAQLSATGQNLLILFGANVSGQHGIGLAMAYLHLAGVALALAGLLAGLACLVRRADRVTQILAVATVATLAAGTLATVMVPLSGAHEIAPVSPLSAVLAGRVIGPWLVSRRLPRRTLAPLLAAVLGGYLACVGYTASQPAQPAETQALADWLVAHHLTGGLAKYWAANSTTLSSGGRVRVFPVSDLAQKPYLWIAKSAWYGPAVSQANFVVAAPQSAGPDGTAYAFPEAGVRSVFGAPAHEYRVGQYIIMVWNKNLLRTVHPPNPAG